MTRLVILALITAAVSCASTVQPEPDADVPMYEPEPEPPSPPPHLTDADPAPIYQERDAAPPVDAGAPAHVDAAPEPEPTVDAGAPELDASTPAPVVKPTACKLPTGVLLTCANRHVYGYDLSWSVGLVIFNCNVPASDVTQCTRGDRCGATHSGIYETGMCE